MANNQGSHPPRLPLRETLDGLPPEWPHDPLPDIRALISQSGKKIVVFDDDPTGTQTVHDVPVLTDYSVDALCREMAEDFPIFYVLTNSRGLPEIPARKLNAAIAMNVAQASQRARKDFILVSRSDSTLRGHFPAETDSITQALDLKYDGLVFTPFFLEGGRYTINNVHYVAEDEWLTPAGQTEFARDPAFSFQSSDVPGYIQEKTGGAIKADAVTMISLEDVRTGGPDRVSEILSRVKGRAVVGVNAVSMRDIEVFMLGLLKTEGKKFIFRTAASLLRAMLGQEGRPLLTASEMDVGNAGGGLTIVGSYVPRTTGQLNHLLGNGEVKGVEIKVERLLEESCRSDEIRRVREEINDLLRDGKDTVAFTSRELVSGNSADESLHIGNTVSQALVKIASSLEARPRYLIAKGGNTCSQIATEALGVRRAWALGQVYPGVPVWRLGEESKYQDMAYVVFPGNVGGDDALTNVVKTLRSPQC
ncbi:MAG: hypothetical protein O2821_08330 [Chloroflexi bacterium]|nr:hypothetical protein [Chloroflexota bacterium]MDA1226994.1 hypothetical protein [Chloroflexota bacterium]